MNIKYRKLPDQTRAERFTFYPLLQVLLRHENNMWPVLALVDSGSADCVLPKSMGDVLGIDVTSGEQHRFHGFDLNAVNGFIHRVSLQVAGFNQWIPIEAVFLETEGMPILGQRGFFERYQVVFEKWARRFEVNTRDDAIIRNRRGYGRGR
ncbi:MAG TPA: retropepsin-like aspartic protease [Pyrinomonadaceae bacterium]|nr:retropepsin-like aspartic protease [Pyrinomonadaceae bacterium]